MSPSFWPRLPRRGTHQQDAVAFLLQNVQTGADLIYFEAFNRPILRFNHPDLIHEMLVRNAPRHHRNLVMRF